MLPIPATFVVGRDGLIKSRFVDPDYRRRVAIETCWQALRERALSSRISTSWQARSSLMAAVATAVR